MSKLKDNIKTLLHERKITTAHLSRETGVPPQTLNNWLSGQEPRSLNQVKKVANFFDVSIDQLCFDLNHYKDPMNIYHDEINAGVFEVVLRRISK